MSIGIHPKDIKSPMSSPFFKGWAKPGPQIPLSDSCQSEILAEIRKKLEVQGISEPVTLDAISGYFRILQLKKGHRFSTDDLLTAWYGTSWCPRADRVLDLGSGIGSVGTIAAWRLSGARFVTIEAQEISVALARESVVLNGLQERYEVRQGDFRDPTLIREDELFDLILGSPPYFPLDAGILGDHPQKIACRFEVRGDISHYCKTAAAHLSLGGVFACIFPISPQEQAIRVEKAAQENGLSILRKRPIVFKEGEAPLLGLFAMSRSDHLPETFRNQTWIEPELTIRMKNGKVHPEYASIKLAIGFPPTD